MIEQPYVRLHEVKAKDLVKEKNIKDSERLKIRESMNERLLKACQIFREQLHNMHQWYRETRSAIALNLN